MHVEGTGRIARTEKEMSQLCWYEDVYEDVKRTWTNAHEAKTRLEVLQHEKGFSRIERTAHRLVHMYMYPVSMIADKRKTKDGGHQ